MEMTVERIAKRKASMEMEIAFHGCIAETGGVGTQEMEKAEIIFNPVTYQEMAVPCMLLYKDLFWFSNISVGATEQTMVATLTRTSCYYD